MQCEIQIVPLLNCLLSLQDKWEKENTKMALDLQYYYMVISLYGNILHRKETALETKGGFLISRIKQVGTRIFDRMLSASGIDSFNGAQGRILYVLWQNDTISISSLSSQTSLANTTLTAMLDRMENNGLIVRKLDPKDRRNRLIALTEKAKSLQNDYDIISQKMNELYYIGFTEKEIVQFESYLQRVLNNLEKE